jgi:hypothetical protein
MFKTLFPTFYETPDTTATAGAVTPEPAAEPETATPEVQPGPWAADLAEYFGDNQEAIAAADRYMREKVQPRITHLETDSAPARELWKDLNENADETLASVVEELYGEETAAKFKAIFEAGDGSEASAAAAVEAATAAEDEVPAWAKPLLEKHEAETAAEMRERQQAEYQEVLAEMRAAHDDLTDEDMELIHPFMSAAEGDIERAYAGYKAYTDAFKARLGVTPTEPEKVDPPPVLGSEGAPAATPPVEKVYKSYDEAIDDYFAERRKQAPPPVI